MPFWGELLVAAVILVGLVGIVVPILPGTLLIVGALFVWALVVGGWAWSVFALAIVVIGIGEVLKYLIAGRSLRADAIPNRTIVVGGLVGIVVQHLSMARIAEGLGVAWNTANDAVLAEGQRALIDDPARFDGVAVIGVDEHVWGA